MSSTRRPKNEGAIVAYDENKASQRAPPPKKRRPKPAAPPREEPDELSAMSEEEHDPNDEPQFKYSTAALDDGGWRNSNCCIISMIILCVIVAIILSIVMVKVFQSQDEENQAPPPTMAPTTAAEANNPGIAMFKLLQSEIEGSACTSSTANSDECRTACAGFDCCDPTLAKDCFHYNQEGCLNYKRCHVTSSGVGVPSALLESVCSPDNIAADPSECERVCSLVSCCWESEVTCFDNFFMCLDYSFCQNLRTNVRVPAATSDVADFCDPTQAGSLSQTTACEDACQPAECCWNGDPTENCLKTDFISCMTYKPCGKLELPAAGRQVSLPPSSIRQECSLATLNTGNTTACELICADGRCCMEDATNDCFSGDPLSCLAYAPCDGLLA